MLHARRVAAGSFSATSGRIKDDIFRAGLNWKFGPGGGLVALYSIGAGAGRALRSQLVGYAASSLAHPAARAVPGPLSAAAPILCCPA
jgi:hypothetical protein